MTKHYRGCPGPNLLPAFPNAQEMDPRIYRNAAGHTVLHDPEIFDRIGFATVDECCLLYECAGQVGGLWAEIGSFVGWTTAHIAASGADVIAVEPELAHAGYNHTGSVEKFNERFFGNLERAGVDDRVTPWCTRSDEFFAGNKDTLDGCFIDGEHEPPFPENDARMLLPHLDADCCVVFHDALGPSIQAGIRVLVDAGFKWRLYRTAQLMAVCWRGHFTPPFHDPDPTFGWDQWIGSIKFDRQLLARQS